MIAASAQLAHTRADPRADPDPDPAFEPPVVDAPTLAGEPPDRRPALTGLVLLIRAAHPRLGLAMTLLLAVSAAASGRAPREVLVVALAVLAGQCVLGWHHDLVDVDRDRDRARQLTRPGKPLAEGRLAASSVWFALAVAVLLVVPLSVSSGIQAATAYLLAVVAGVLGNVVLRTGALSWVLWAVWAALLPAFLSYGGWGGQFAGDRPRTVVVVLAALLGIGLHVALSLRGLEADAAQGWRTLPLRLSRRLGLSRLRGLTLVWMVGLGGALIAVCATGGLSA